MAKKSWWTKLRREQAMCVLVSVLMFAAAAAVQGQQGILVDGGRVPRSGYGQGETTYRLAADGVWQEKMPIEITVGEREYTPMEAEQVFPEAFEVLLTEILGENASLGEVRSDLNLISSLDAYGIRVSWQSENPERVNSFGQVENEDVKAGGEQVKLMASLRSGEFKRDFYFPVTVLPPFYMKEEQSRKEFLDYLEKQDEEQRAQAFFNLPESFKGKKITYSEEADTDYFLILLLGVLAAAALPCREKSREKNQKQRRERQMLLDYPEIVSKLAVYLGAGVGTKSSWRMIAREYEAGVKGGKRSQRFAYEEMCRAVYQMDSGTAEGKAYRMFGERCGLRPYQKLAALLEQNMRVGTRGMRRLLEEEMADALEKRKDLARRQGEEAGTKLLLPLFMMLGIVMVMIVVPAWMSFQF